MTGGTTGPRLVSLEIRGFRAFGTEARTLQLDAPLVVVHAGNSQGKTSLTEAIEFLISGRSSRREMLGGSKAEYHDSLRNAHLPAADTDVYVQALVRDAAGTTHEVRRELLSDFSQGAECDSRLLVDGVKANNLDHVGLPLADPPVRAPVLLQHTLRHVLSTEPKQRVGYFKALLELTDLDLFRERVRAARGRIDAEQPGSAFRLLKALTGTPAGSSGESIAALAKKPITTEAAKTAIDSALLTAGRAVLALGGAEVDDVDDVDALRHALVAALEDQREQVFPLSAFATGPLGTVPEFPNLDEYRAALDELDHQAAQHTPLFEAVLGIEEYGTLEQPVDCPVCGTSDALTPNRIGELRDYLRRTQSLSSAARSTTAALAEMRHGLDRLVTAASASVPAAARWTVEQVTLASDNLRGLGIDAALAAGARTQATDIAVAATALTTACAALRGALEQAGDAVAGRHPVATDLEIGYRNVVAAADNLSTAVTEYNRSATVLRTAVDAASRERVAVSGLREVANLVRCRNELITDVVSEGTRQQIIRRLNTAEKALNAAAGAVLDTKFTQMSDTITKWWATIRPDELVGFGGIKRRAGGALFVNLVAALRIAATSTPVEREALGVYSDSQLNALGLSIFLARTELLGTRIVVLDDPIPGSDSDHRLSFIQTTLGQLLASDTQVILTTFDSKFAKLTQANHGGGNDYLGYKLDLINILDGTEPTQTCDVFGQLMLEAQESLYAPTARGRRPACNVMRTAAERLAKQIVASGQTHAGIATTVEDIEAKASTLGALLPLVLPLVVDGNAERGLWRTFPQVLNPGSHDDDVPSTADLKVVFGNLNKIARDHRKHWPGGLLE
ncbi:AAA family ATPase [Mycobacterium sp.]|uniref:AAA family ATPase n=1 Tax=Mycobacterium sp. TaxID=1785 RepID=UPI003D14B464